MLTSSSEMEGREERQETRREAMGVAGLPSFLASIAGDFPPFLTAGALQALTGVKGRGVLAAEPFLAEVELVGVPVFLC